MRKVEIRNKIFEMLKEISESKSHSGLLIIYSDLLNVLRRGAYPLGEKKEFKEFDEIAHINSKNAREILKKIGEDGAILIDKKGYIYSPAVYLNVNLFSIDEEKIEPDFGARHIAALATSSTTKASVYTLSEETGKVREFIKGKIKRRYPTKQQEKIIEIIKKDLKSANKIKE